MLMRSIHSLPTAGELGIDVDRFLIGDEEVGETKIRATNAEADGQQRYNYFERLLTMAEVVKDRRRPISLNECREETGDRMGRAYCERTMLRDAYALASLGVVEIAERRPMLLVWGKPLVPAPAGDRAWAEGAGLPMNDAAPANDAANRRIATSRLRPSRKDMLARLIALASAIASREGSPATIAELRGEVIQAIGHEVSRRTSVRDAGFLARMGIVEGGLGTAWAWVGGYGFVGGSQTH